MKYDPDKHHRRSIRLQGYDYSTPGAYFITLCAYQRQCLFGDVVDGAMELNEYGQIVLNEWLKSAEIRQEIAFDAWIIMPNHLHGIVFIHPSENPVGANGCSPPPGPTSPLQPRLMSPQISDENPMGNELSPAKARANNRIASGMATLTPLPATPQMKPRSLASFIAGFKSATTASINTLRKTSGTPVWQRNYYEHIIRDDHALFTIRQYVHNNPLTWMQDQLHPQNPSKW